MVEVGSDVYEEKVEVVGDVKVEEIVVVSEDVGEFILVDINEE